MLRAWAVSKLQRFFLSNIDSNKGDLIDVFCFQDYYLTDNLLDVEHAAVQRTRKKRLKTECHKRKITDIYPLNTDFNKGINPSAFRNILVSLKEKRYFLFINITLDLNISSIRNIYLQSRTKLFYIWPSISISNLSSISNTSAPFSIFCFSPKNPHSFL